MLIPMLLTAFLAQTPPPSCTDSAHLSLDFWVGRWEVQNVAGQVTAEAFTLSRLDDGVRQLGERSDDGGKTWIAEFDLRYRRSG